MPDDPAKADGAAASARQGKSARTRANNCCTFVFKESKRNRLYLVKQSDTEKFRSMGPIIGDQRAAEPAEDEADMKVTGWLPRFPDFH